MIPKIISQKVEPKVTHIEWADGTTGTVIGSNTAKIREALYISKQSSNALDAFDYVALFKDGLNRSGNQAVNGEFIKEVPFSKGVGSLKVSSLDQPRTETMNFTNGYVNIDNENKFYFVSDSIDIKPGSEDWFTGIDLSGFPYEAYMNIYGKYLGEYGGSLRSTNGNTDDAMFKGVKIPKYKPFVVRMQYTRSNTLKLWVDGVYAGEKNTYLTGTDKKFTHFGIGTDTNNAKWFCSSLLHSGRMLSDDEALKAYKELSKTTFDYPYMSNVSISVSNGTVSANGDYNSPKEIKEDLSKRVYRWYSAGNGQSADVTNNKLEPVLNNKQSFNIKDYPELNGKSQFRVDIECTDVNGLTFNGASGCPYVKIN